MKKSCLFDRCPNDRHSRGQCRRHYHQTLRLIHKGLTTWEKQIKLGHALARDPRGRSGGLRQTIMSYREIAGDRDKPYAPYAKQFGAPGKVKTRELAELALRHAAATVAEMVLIMGQGRTGSKLKDCQTDQVVIAARYLARLRRTTS